VDELIALSQELETASSLLTQGLLKVETSIEMSALTLEKAEKALKRVETALKQAETELQPLADLKLQIKDLEQSFEDYRKEAEEIKKVLLWKQRTMRTRSIIGSFLVGAVVGVILASIF
jgi:peptidoglycan hydrolase CwlO-like protein